MIVIFGGTAAYHLRLDDHAQVGERRIIATPYGDSAPFVQLTAGGKSCWFSSRHGEGGLQRSAAFVNHRANIWAARELGASGILSWNGVGAIAPGLSVGQLVVPDDVLDMTRARTASFLETGRGDLLGRPYDTTIDENTSSSFSPLPEGEGTGVRACNAPFSADLRTRLIAACTASGKPYATHGTYVCTEGPRLETAAEIAMYGWGGAAVVGMTLVPEVWLAAELGIPYASLCIVTNMATGRWQLDPRRDFGPGVGVTGLHITLSAL
ncbi:MAG: MTAP family purine nucleoside phosphorylase [Chloroflexi bacterium]|nr:MTAP family purine nucleoside phosphorylase [Chloroflexota bacterium]